MEKVLESNRILDRIVATIGDLPSTPTIIASLMTLTSNINADIKRITDTLKADQSMTARVLKMANSSFYGRATQISTLREAIIILGFNTLRSLVLASSTHSLYQGNDRSDIKDKLWEHALATAISARLIAEKTRHPHAEEAFVAGLLHDIGKLVMIEKLPARYKEVVAEVETGKGKFIEIEEVKFGFNHTDVGLLLLHRWSFPEELYNSVYEHHDPGETNAVPIPLSYILNLANAIAKTLDVGFNDYRVEDIATLPAAAKINVSRGTIEEIKEELKSKFVEEKAIFSAAA